MQIRLAAFLVLDKGKTGHKGDSYTVWWLYGIFQFLAQAFCTCLALKENNCDTPFLLWTLERGKIPIPALGISFRYHLRKGIVKLQSSNII